MDFVNQCIMDSYCQNKCTNRDYCKDNNFEPIRTNECNVYRFINWLNENGKNIPLLIKLNEL